MSSFLFFEAIKDLPFDLFGCFNCFIGLITSLPMPNLIHLCLIYLVFHLYFSICHCLIFCGFIQIFHFNCCPKIWLNPWFSKKNHSLFFLIYTSWKMSLDSFISKELHRFRRPFLFSQLKAHRFNLLSLFHSAFNNLWPLDFWQPCFSRAKLCPLLQNKFIRPPNFIGILFSPFRFQSFPSKQLNLHKVAHSKLRRDNTLGILSFKHFLWTCSFARINR